MLLLCLFILHLLVLALFHIMHIYKYSIECAVREIEPDLFQESTDSELKGY